MDVCAGVGYGEGQEPVTFTRPVARQWRIMRGRRVMTMTHCVM